MKIVSPLQLYKITLILCQHWNCYSIFTLLLIATTIMKRRPLFYTVRDILRRI